MQQSETSSWYIKSPRFACFGDSLLASSFVHYYPESLVGDGKSLTITLPEAGHGLRVGDKIKVTGYDKEICSRIFTVTSAAGKQIKVLSSFRGTAKKLYYFKASCNSFKLKPGYAGQAVQRLDSKKPLFSVAMPAASVGIVSRDALLLMDYELMPFADTFDVVLIQLGTNDMSVNNKFTVAGYIENMEKIVSKLQSAGKKVIIGNLPPVSASADQAVLYSERIREANKELDGLGRRYAVPVLDFYSGLAGKDGFAKKEYMSDARHPNAKGYAIMSDVLLAHAKKYFAASD